MKVLSRCNSHSQTPSKHEASQEMRIEEVTKLEKGPMSKVRGWVFFDQRLKRGKINRPLQRDHTTREGCVASSSSTQ